MHVDLMTIYLLAVGTLLVSAAMTLWERKARPDRRQSLGAWAGGYIALAIGCVMAAGHAHWPGVTAIAVSNILIMVGYLLILDGVAALSGRQHRLASLAAVMALTVLWFVAGSQWRHALWSYISAFPIAVTCSVTAWEMRRNDGLASLRASRIVVGVTGCYAVLYAFRACVLPVMGHAYGPQVVAMAGAVTMYSGVLYSVMLPMALLALVREEDQARLLKLALTDYLTGLGNRQWFFEQGSGLIGACQHPVSLLAFDMDHFKTINDRYGHATGDEVLKAFAQTLRTTLGPGAILARMGGEEFAALLPDCDRHMGCTLGQAVMRCFAETAARPGDGIGLQTTVSAGLAELGRQGSDLKTLLAAADRALYAAKALGRNRIELAGDGCLAAA